jgi:hypothetical protein
MKKPVVDAFQNQKGFHDLQEWINFFNQFWQNKLKKLEDLLNKKTRK